MTNARVEDRVTQWVQPITEQMGLELIDVEYVKEGGHWFLRVYIDKEAGVDLEDCQAVSRALDEILDQEDPIPHNYSLEVSSPGIERPLKREKDFIRFKGQRVRATTYLPVDRQKEFIGNLLGMEDDGLHLELNGQEIILPKDKVAKVQLFPVF